LTSLADQKISMVEEKETKRREGGERESERDQKRPR
jgi:hypothetical protein